MERTIASSAEARDANANAPDVDWHGAANGPFHLILISFHSISSTATVFPLPSSSSSLILVATPVLRPAFLVLGL